MASALYGLLGGIFLFIAIGSPNVYVLRQGIRREHLLPVVTVCIVSVGVLITAGASGLGDLVRAVPELVAVARWVDIDFLLGYPILAARRALHGGEPMPTDGSGWGSVLGAAVVTALALTWLNPHVYVDTVLRLSSLAAIHGARAWQLAAGAVVGGTLWFEALRFGTRGLGRMLSSARRGGRGDDGGGGGGAGAGVKAPMQLASRWRRTEMPSRAGHIGHSTLTPSHFVYRSVCTRVWLPALARSYFD